MEKIFVRWTGANLGQVQRQEYSMTHLVTNIIGCSK